MYFFTWGTTYIISTRPSRNEWPSWSDMANIANYHTLSYGTYRSFWWMYTFIINVNNWSYIACSTTQTLGKPWWWINYATKTDNWYKTFSIKPTCFSFSTCFTKGNCTYWHKSVKYGSSFTKVFLGYLHYNCTSSKWYLIYAPSTQKIFSSHDVVFNKKNLMC